MKRSKLVFAITCVVLFVLYGIGCTRYYQMESSEASQSAESAESLSSFELTEEIILAQQHRPHEVEEVERGKLDINGNLIDEDE